MPRHEPTDLDIAGLIHDEAWEDIARAFAGYHPADIADVIGRAAQDDHERLFTLLDDAIKPDVLAELESEAETEIIESLTDSELSDIVEDMSPDDAADILGELTEERSQEVLKLMEDEESEDVRRLLAYPEESAGGIMTTDVVAMRADQTVADAIQAVAYVDPKEQFFNAYIVNESGNLVGYAGIWDLLREPDKNRPLGQVAHADVYSADVEMDQEEVARLIHQYDLNAVPVVDAGGRLVGRVTADDVIDVIEEEASEDIFRLAGSDDVELETESAIRSCRARLPWLLITLLGGFLTTMILSKFLASISQVIVLAAFVPTILAMGGNTGIQSSTLIVRSIALGNLEGRSIFRLLLREILTGALMGCICGAIIAAWAHFVIARATAEPPAGLSAHCLAGVVALALFSAMTFATLFGALVPMVLNKAKIDPAVASGPFVTITNDISALLIYFAVTLSLLQAFA